MRHYEFVQAVEANPVIAAIKDDEGLEQCLHSDIGIVFILYGDIGSIVGIVKRLKDAGKVAMVHMDLISGLQAKDVSVDYIRNYTEADGIITTKFNLIQHARDIGLNTILRMFMLDSTSMDSFEKNGRSESVQPDIVEVLPGTLLPEVIQRLNRLCRVPVMVSGLITAKSEVYNALKNGAVSISTTNQALWFI
ncbi:glycerol uptake operon antiterminator [Moryella indoligenes]|uniref:Glycerol uptake operon antiterminator n=1 Tax=Moryella indoligenes TaxID=371674 RepID=A0AAE4AK51_9FIRM|nr:glycerol-3-phosphate responsive antiterminator [Moryella indoligenes]MDQ0151615.1 glycerol uptake operon antiterminator [Moryella indoligenes]